MRPLPGHHVMPQLRSCKMGRNGQEPAALVDDDTCQAGVAGALQPVLLWRRLWHRRANLHSQAENRPSPKPGVVGSSPTGPVAEKPRCCGVFLYPQPSRKRTTSRCW